MSGFRKLFRSALVTFQVIALVVMPFSAAYASETLNYDTDIMTGSSEDFDSSQFEGQESGPSVSSSPSNSEINESMNSEEDEDDLQNVNSEPSISVDSSTDDNDSETSENDDAPSLDEKRNESVSTEPTSTGGSADEPLLKAEIQAHVSKVGWTQFEDCSKYVGVTDGSNYLEAFRVILPSEVDGSIEARVHVAKIGWQDWIGLDVDSFAGTTGNALAIEAVQLRLSGDIASEYDVWYRVYSENIGWSGWANDGSSAGTQGYGIAAQAIEIRFIEKGKPAPGETESAFKAPYVTYQAHSQTIGWQEYLNDGETAGTTGRALRLEALNISLGPAAGEGGIEARAHVAKEGWQDWTAGTIGTTGKKLAIEALQIRLTGDAASKYDVWIGFTRRLLVGLDGQATVRLWDLNVMENVPRLSKYKFFQRAPPHLGKLRIHFMLPPFHTRHTFSRRDGCLVQQRIQRPRSFSAMLGVESDSRQSCFPFRIWVGVDQSATLRTSSILGGKMTFVTARSLELSEWAIP